MRREFISVSVETTLDEALRVMRLARLRHLLVESGGLLAGLLSYRDLQDELLTRLDERAADADERTPGPLEEIAVGRAMVDSPYRVTRDTPLAEAANRMTRLRLGCLPVVEETGQGLRLVGLVTASDLLDAAYNPAWNAVTSSRPRR